ncbi:hypothetical protein GSI_04181 [Ganoderma sinense ZZ0214-1]|uniref:Uncharacterized protein n=1 Tax=Ganoderma sinense ZZ0214-1 TaxID=1077348 RepID=A0A2G8SJ25_9APHY|nr:hypothetical protein GSI_04181 [Ganoderma sinense ZZ0214-1]
MFKSKANAGASILPVADQGRAYLGVRATGNPSTQEDALKQALLAVVQLWEDRLQKEGVLTTFFITIDSLLFSLASPTRSADLHGWSVRDQVINASLGGAIIFHVCASIVAYSASFVLIKYQLNDAEKKEEKYFPTSPDLSRAPSISHRTPQSSTEKPERPRRKHTSHSHRPSTSQGSHHGSSNPIETITDFPLEVFTDLRGLVSMDRAHPFWFLSCGRRPRPRDRDEEQVRARSRGDPEAMVGHTAARLKDMIDVLSRAHVVCAGMALVGFVLALLGILTYAWTAVPLALSVFASACLGVCVIAATVALW